jgi:hypothetical protein
VQHDIIDQLLKQVGRRWSRTLWNSLQDMQIARWVIDGIYI